MRNFLIRILQALVLLAVASSFAHANDFVHVKKKATAAGGGGTTYFSLDFESATNWYDPFNDKDDTPSGQITLDNTSKISGADSLKVDIAAIYGATYGWKLLSAKSELYIQAKIYIDNTSAPTSGQGWMVVGHSPDTFNQGCTIFIYYDTNHYEVQAFIRDDANAQVYSSATDESTGTTINTMEVVIITIYYKAGTGADGEVWHKVNNGAWTKKTGLDLNTKAALYDRVYAGVLGFKGSNPSDSQWIYYVDDIKVADYDISP